MLRLMTHGKPSGDTVPRGVKENVMFLLDNTNNIERRSKGKQSVFIDDCGVWSKPSCKTHHYVMEGDARLNYVDKKNDVFVKDTKGQRVALNPQPPKDKVIILKRYYVSLKRDPTFKRRISTVYDCPDSLKIAKNVVVIEYVGTYPELPAPHGNSKKTCGDYVRTSASVKRKLDELVNDHNPPRHIYEEMALDSSQTAPRKYLAIKRGKAATSTNHRVNVADDIQTVLSEFHDHPFMQEIIQTKGKPPSAILYLEETLNDISKLCTPCASHPSVVGIDRTFNLGACFATILAYHNTNLIRKGTTNPPIMLGAVYLHWDGLYTTYHRFLSHLQSKLAGNICAMQTSNIVVGSDEEAALTKVIKQCFPSSHHLLCTRHLQENVRKYLSDKVGANAKVQRKIIKDIFGEKGLASYTNETDFEVEAINLEDEYGILIPSFVKYFNLIVEKIRNGILIP